MAGCGVKTYRKLPVKVPTLARQFKLLSAVLRLHFLMVFGLKTLEEINVMTSELHGGEQVQNLGVILVCQFQARKHCPIGYFQGSWMKFGIRRANAPSFVAL
ncbi:hypothetical protein [Cognatishimia sp. MH4019]|uniref:hypothetical protein n=1 Tax=Cognatishimia sp. MH4019 TaxID=2854030 RepID=UPI001CD6AACA|nr:hypothetical protein [Cognatishimia sp. MH4019]